MPELTPTAVLPGDITTWAMYRGRPGLSKKVINRWRERGYLNEDGERVKVEPIDGLTDERGHAVYWTADLEAAEASTRYRARRRGNPILAADQNRHRAARRRLTPTRGAPA